ncbi:SpoIIIAH-like family protein [Salirhabdus salicampi]|nr:SpoIIIAH-like family protein [Salirhabdus salicampi]MCP8616820.1 SpoIIIAH-like family protein [Salirhabdus salicampi]
MLKKQTVWLLTMLSLLIVLSVYYMTSPNGEQVALFEQMEEMEGTEESESLEANKPEGEEGETVTSGISSDELFTAIRMDIQSERDRTREQLENIIASSNASPEEKNEAMEQMHRLEEVNTKESILEKVIQTEKNYTDVLVRAEEEIVHVTVKAGEVSQTDANQIMQLVRDEFGDIRVIVKHQPENT